MIKAVIFDLDGTIVDSEPLHLKAWDRALREQHYSWIDLSYHLRATKFGKKSMSIAQEIVSELHLSISPEEFLRRKTNIFINSIENELKTMKGLFTCLKELKESKYKLAIATSGQMEYVKIIIDKFKLNDFFDVVITAEEVIHGKPNPEMFRLACKKLKLRPNECIVVEDSINGIKSANAAGCITIAFNNKYNKSQDFSLADEIVFSLLEIMPNAIKKLRAKRII